MTYGNNYRLNLIKYWQQYYPNWTIPKGYHVHHIKPKSCFGNNNDASMQHPRNLIALHPDDHASIHSCRGDTYLTKLFITSVVGRKQTEEFKQARRNYRHSDLAKQKISKTHKNKPKSKEHRTKISHIRKGMKLGPPSKIHKQHLSEALRDRKFTDEHRHNISVAGKGKKAWNKGIRAKNEAKQRMSNAKLDKLNPNFGKKWFNNEVDSAMFILGQEPIGFILGRKL